MRGSSDPSDGDKSGTHVPATVLGAFAQYLVRGARDKRDAGEGAAEWAKVRMERTRKGRMST